MKKVINSVSLLISGICIGWLSGLSISPVIQIILTSLMSLIASVAAISVGLEKFNNVELSKKLNSIVPITLLIVGISIGAPIGVYARTNNFFGEDPERLVNILVKTGIPRDASKKFIMNYEVNNLKLKSTGRIKKDDPSLGQLMSSNTTLCDLITELHGKTLRKVLEQQKDPELDEKLKQCRDSVSLEHLKTTLCE